MYPTLTFDRSYSRFPHDSDSFSKGGHAAF